MPLPTPTPETSALITGASAGIGREFARQLAGRGHNVTLVARRADRLEALARELSEAHGVRADVVPADLADDLGRNDLISELDRRGIAIDVLVNNAGFGIYRAFAASDLDREYEQLSLLIGAVIHLNAVYLPRMLARGSGTIINVSSTSAFQPLPGNGTYAASKAFVLFHSEALSHEVKGSGVTVTAVCPGPVRTEFQETSQPLFADRLPKFAWTTAEQVARDGLRAAERGKRTVIPGGVRVRAFFGPNRVVPVGISLPVAGRLMSKEVGLGSEPAKVESESRA